MALEIRADQICPFLTCLEEGAHTHPVCPECDAVRYGNLFCATCRAQHPEIFAQPHGPTGPATRSTLIG